MTRVAVIFAIVLLPFAQPANGQSGTERSGPRGRGHHTLFYDEARQRVLLTGGATVDSRRNYENLNDLWSFDGTAWTALPSSGDRLSGMRVDIDAQKRIYSF